MQLLKSIFSRDPLFTISILILISISVLVLNSIAPSIFPVYFFYIFVSIIALILFSLLDYRILHAFYWHLYILSIVFLILPLIIGQITRGAVRWIPIGPITIQPSEIVRPFLLVFFSVYVTENVINIKKLVIITVMSIIPLFLILIQPSLGVSIITFVGIIGIISTSNIDRKLLLSIAGIVLILIPIFWLVLAPYQKQRIIGFINPNLDSKGAGYNSIQAMISVGSGKLFGRGLGKGVQTQLAFLPEKNTDFIFASIAEELGFMGAGIVLLCLFVIMFRMTTFLNRFNDSRRSFIVGVICIMLAETVIHIGMNMGLLPITGLPLPLVSAGGSALLATSISLGIVLGIIKSPS